MEQMACEQIIVVLSTLLGTDVRRFLWVALQLDEICRQTCDEDIKLVLKDLPKDLAETYSRMLDRITRNQKAKLATKAFTWIATVERPLLLAELQEAMAIKPFAPYSNPERLINDPATILSSCEGLLLLQEDGEVHFAHRTIRAVITRRESTSECRVDLDNTDRQVGELCVTYLSFNDFKTQLVKTPKLFNIPATRVIESSIPRDMDKRLVGMITRLPNFRRQSRTKSTFDVLDSLARVPQSGNRTRLHLSPTNIHFSLMPPNIGYRIRLASKGETRSGDLG